MAGKTLSFFLKLNDKEFQSGLRKNIQKLDKFGKKMQRTGRNLSRNLTLPLAAFGGVAVAAFDKQAKAIAQVDAGLRSTGASVGFTSEKLQQMAADLQAKTLFGDEVILKDATAQLLTFTNITGEQFEKTQVAALNLATRLDGDLKTSSIQLGKALNDPVANLGALAKSGIQFSEEQKAVIKSLAETNRLADAQNIILEELEKQYGGSAEAAAQAGAGPLLQLKNRLGDLTEDIGRLLLPMLVKLAEGLKSIMTAFSNLSPEGKRLTVVIGILVAGIGPMLTLFGSLSAVVGVLSIKFIAIAAAVAALGLGVLYVLDNWEAFKERFTDISWWKNTLISMTQFLIQTSPIALFLKGINAALEFLGKNPIPNPFEDAADGLEELKEDTKDYENEFQDFGTFITNQGKKIKNVFSGIGDAFNVGAPSGGGGGESQPQAPKFDLGKFTDFSFRVVPEVDKQGFSLLVKTKDEIEKLNEAAKKLAETQQDVASTFQSAFHSMAVSAEASGEQMAAAAANAARQVIKAKIAEATASYAADAFAKLGFLGVVLAAAAGSVVGSLFNKIIPPFAEGGMVSGATLAMVGEGPGTSAINPEVIAPLDKLQGMIGNAGGGQVEVVGKISGSDILLASDRARGNRTRTRGY